VAPSRRFGRSRFTLILLVLASLTVLTLDYRDTGPVQGLRSVFGTVFSPFEGVGNAIASPFENGWKGIFEYDDLEEENRRLQRQIDELTSQDVEDAAREQELEELERLTQLEFGGDVERVYAQLSEGPRTSFESTFEINRGSGDGVEEGMVVVTDAGLVGRIEEVSGGSSRVRVITDPDYGGFGVKLVQGRDVGIARAVGQDGMLRVEEGIELATPVERGDDVVTSGLDDSSYPPNIPVGQVERIGRTDDLTERVLDIEPSADLDGLSYVAVLLCTDDCA
jgi:rod shape-determining protein MreC